MSARALARVPGALLSVTRHRTGRRDRPRMLTHTVTYSCNARCVMCASWRMDSSRDLRLEEIARIYAQLPTMDVVRLTGGEPFLRTDLAAIAELAVEHLRPLVLHVTTNGFLTDRVRRFCEQRDRSTPLHVLLSIDGVGAKHDEVRGRRDAWDRALATLEVLAPRREEWNLDLAVNQTVVDAEAAEQHAELCARLRPLDVPVQLVVAYAESATYNLEAEQLVDGGQQDGYRTFSAIPPETLARLMAVARAELEGLPPVSRAAKRYYLRGLDARLQGRPDARAPRCVALSAHLRLLPDGAVPTCQFNGRVVGNLRRQSFEEVWSGELALEQRRWVERCRGCWAECEVVPNAAYSGRLLPLVVAERLGLARR